MPGHEKTVHVVVIKHIMDGRSVTSIEGVYSSPELAAEALSNIKTYTAFQKNCEFQTVSRLMDYMLPAFDIEAATTRMST